MSSKIILDKYFNLLNDLLMQIESKKYVYRKKTTEIIGESFNIVKHIFINSLLYTDDIDLVFSYTEKGFFFFLEFMEQINYDNHSMLELTTKDAKLFVYKKTIYNLNNDDKNNTSDSNYLEKENYITYYSDKNNKTISHDANISYNTNVSCNYKKDNILVVKCIDIIHIIINCYINKIFLDTEENNLKNKLNDFKTIIKNIISLIKLINKNVSQNEYNELINLNILFINSFIDIKEIDIISYCKIFNQKISKENFSNIDIKLKSVYNKNNLLYLNENKYFKWLFN